MSKVHLIESCEVCIYQWNDHCVKAKADIDTCEDFPDWCPLPDLPERLQVQNPELLDAAYEVLGWNKCLDAITGGKET